MFDGAGFVRGVEAQGLRVAGATCLVVGTGGVGSAIAASLAAAGVARDRRCSTSNADVGRGARGRGCASTIRRSRCATGSNDPAGFDLVVNATPLGMKEGDPLPFDVYAPRTRRRSSARS